MRLSVAGLLKRASEGPSALAVVVPPMAMEEALAPSRKRPAAVAWGHTSPADRIARKAQVIEE